MSTEEAQKCKCEHNNHSHLFIWMFIWASLFAPSCVDCSGERARMKSSVSSLEWKNQELERKVHSLEAGDIQYRLKNDIAVLQDRCRRLEESDRQRQLQGR